MNDTLTRATKPTQLSASDWWQIVKRVFAKLEQHNVTMLSAAVSFYAMLALFPALAAIVSVYAMFSNPAEVINHLDLLSTVIPKDVTSILTDQLVNITQVYSETLGLRLVVGLIFSIWSAHRGVHALINAITIAYQEKETRNIVRLNLLSLGMTIGATVIIVIALTTMLAVPAVLIYFPVSVWQASLTTALCWMAFLIAIIASLSVLYRYAPPRRPAQWRWLSAGAILSTILCICGSAGFAIYVRYFGNYNETYGTLGAFIVLLIWFFLTNFAIVLGAMLNAEMELQTYADTTTGKVQPMGQRGAYVADTPPQDA